MICCAFGCGHKAGRGCHFYNFPSPNDGPDWEKWYNIWVLRINRVNPDGSQWRPEAANTKLCSCHFRPEDQWDPKSRKGGLKCKEPVFFQYNLDPSSMHMAASPTCTQDASYTDGDALKQPWFLANLPNASVENTDQQEGSRRALASRRLKCKNSLRSSRIPPLKIRDYFEKKENTKRISLKKTEHATRKQQYLTSVANSANEQDRCINLNTSSEQQQGTQQVSVRNLQDSDPCVIDDEVIEDNCVDAEVIEISESDDSVQDDLSVQQGCLKHEQLDSCDEFLHIEPTVQVPETTAGVCVKSEVDGSSISDESLLDYHEVIHTPRIISTHSIQAHDGSQDHDTEQHTSDFTHFIETGHHHLTPRENLEVVLPNNSSQNARISNVKPIRVFTSKSCPSDSVGITPTESLHTEGVCQTEDIQSENVYDQMFNQLMASGAPFFKDSGQASVSQGNALNIAEILSDSGTSTTSTCTQLNLNQALNRIKELEKALTVQKFGLHRFCASEEKIKFYTGFKSADMLMRFFWRIEPDDLTSERSSKWMEAMKLAKGLFKEPGGSADVSRKVIPYIDELFLFLCHVWLGLQPGDLADRFALPSSSYAEFIIIRWIYYLQATLPGTADRGRSTSATSKSVRFQGQYSNTKLLLHQHEMKVQLKSVLNHLSSAKLNAVVGFSPSGEVVFASDVMSEVFSNRHLQNSGVLSLLQSGDGVILNSEFVREDLFSSVGVTVHSLPDLDMPHDPTAFQLGTSNRTSHMCRHTEVARLLSAKYVGSVTGFKCFQSVIFYPFAHIVKDLWEVCCRLVNYQQGYRSL